MNDDENDANPSKNQLHVGQQHALSLEVRAVGL